MGYDRAQTGFCLPHSQTWPCFILFSQHPTCRTDHVLPTRSHSFPWWQFSHQQSTQGVKNKSTKFTVHTRGTHRLSKVTCTPVVWVILTKEKNVLHIVLIQSIFFWACSVYTLEKWQNLSVLLTHTVLPQCKAQMKWRCCSKAGKKFNKLWVVAAAAKSHKMILENFLCLLSATSFCVHTGLFTNKPGAVNIEVIWTDTWHLEWAVLVTDNKLRWIHCISCSQPNVNVEYVQPWCLEFRLSPCHSPHRDTKLSTAGSGEWL